MQHHVQDDLEDDETIYDSVTEFVSDRAQQRNLSVIANDGIIASAGLLEGLAGAGASGETLAVAATALMVSGMLSFAGSTWIAEAQDRDASIAVMNEERLELEKNPDKEFADLKQYYLDKGLSDGLAHAVSEELTRIDALAAHLETEHDIHEIANTKDIFVSSAAAGLAFGFGALIPMLITTFTPRDLSMWLIVISVGISLMITSLFTSWLGKTSIRRTLIRSLIVGFATMAVSFLVGRLVF